MTLMGIIKGNAQTDNIINTTATPAGTGNNNTFVGVASGTNNTSNSNSGFGINTLTNATGGFNSAFGAGSLVSNLGGTVNCAFGSRSMESNTSGYENVAIGHRALGANISGFDNVAIGYAASLITSGSGNVSVGYYTPRNLTSGDNNIFIGSQTAVHLLSGNNNTILGRVDFTDSPSTTLVAGNDTSNTIILADGDFVPGTSGGHQRLFIHSNGYAGIGLGNNNIPLNRLELGNGIANTAGLRFRNFNNTSFTTLNPSGKVLSVNNVGDVILVDDAIGGGSGNSNDWHLRGNAGTSPALTRQEGATPASDFLGTTDNQDLVFRVNSLRSGLIQSSLPVGGNETKANTSFGFDSLTSTTPGNNNTAVGFGAMKNVTKGYNAAFGYNALLNDTNGGNNVAIGSDNLSGLGRNATAGGNGNVGIGRWAGNNINTGSNNVIIGFNSGPTSSTCLGNNISNRLYIDSNSNFGAGSDSPLIYGEFDNRELIFNVTGATGASAINRVVINGPAANSTTMNVSGLNFADIISGSPTQVNTSNKFLTVNGTGDVVLETLPSSSAPCTIYNCDGIINNTPADPNNPGFGLRTVTMAGNNLYFKTNGAFGNGTDGTGRIYIGNTMDGFSYPTLTATSQFRLMVEGGILTERVKVALRNTANWSDYVFANNYKLMPLKEVETFITKNKHLPGIDSASDLVKNGLDLGEMQAKQMGKIEELTLYVIKQDKEIEELKAQVKALLEKK